MRELQECAKHMQRENYRLQAQVEKGHNLGEKDMQNSGQAKHPTACNKGKELVVLDNVDTPAEDELSSSSSPDLSLAKSNRARSRQRCTHCLAFSNLDGGTFR